jgi:predicted HTH transcriptional regulator
LQSQTADADTVGEGHVGQVEEAMAFVRRNTRMAAKIEGKLERTERWEYPPDAVREAITNAVCHRDYADSGNVVVRVFDDRLEVSNPGGLAVRDDGGRPEAATRVEATEQAGRGCFLPHQVH